MIHICIYRESGPSLPLPPTENDIADFMRQASSTSARVAGAEDKSVKMAGLFLMTMFGKKKINGSSGATDGQTQRTETAADKTPAPPNLGSLVPTPVPIATATTTCVVTKAPFHTGADDLSPVRNESCRTQSIPTDSPFSKPPRRFRGIAPPPREPTKREKAIFCSDTHSVLYCYILP